MKTIWQARNLIMHGYSVKEVSKRLKLSESTVRLYTKSERARASLSRKRG